jgi:hypothetical protein
VTDADLSELLPLYALDLLDGDEAKSVERAVAADPALAAELASYRDATHELAAAGPAVAAPADVERRLMASIGGGPFERFAERVGKIFDVTVDRARELLGLIERPASWVPQIIPGISLVHFEGGPAAAAADCGFIRLAPGTMFPPHTHLGEEVVTILSGRVHDVTNDRLLGPGDDYVQLEGTNHYKVCVGDEDCIYASRAINGISIGGTRAQPRKN